MSKVLRKAKRELLIKTIQENVSSIKNLNQGGCGIFAHLVGVEFEKRGYTIKLPILNNLARDFKGVKHDLNNYINNDVIGDNLLRSSFAHCCISIGRTKFDSNGTDLDGVYRSIGVHDKNWSQYKLVGNYTTSEMNIALQFGQWNTNYDTNQNPKMKREIRKAFKKVLGK
tara:strand:+ start:569 stop:1078 length:510 start_codon:yes stop_codon:yes gene_type:complete